MTVLGRRNHNTEQQSRQRFRRLGTIALSLQLGETCFDDLWNDRLKIVYGRSYVPPDATFITELDEQHHRRATLAFKTSDSATPLKKGG